ncbi:hypothetical protein ACHAWF_012959 [Thalassiosira exigua]
MVDWTTQPKIKFKKRVKKGGGAGPSLRGKRRRVGRSGGGDEDAAPPSASADPPAAATASDDDDDDDDDGDGSALEAVLAAERRRKLLGSGRGRGVDASKLGKDARRSRPTSAGGAKGGIDGDGGEEEDGDRNKDLEDRLEVTFAGGKLAGTNDMGGGDGGGVLATKHRKAMEEFIRRNLGEDGAAAGGAGEANDSSEGGAKNPASEAEREMYAELLEGDDAKGGPAGTPAAGEGDVGAGGAMMGGTGIAEVALPIDERIEALKETERAAAEHERARKARFGRTEDEMPPPPANAGVLGGGRTDGEPSLAGMVPMNFASGPGKRTREDVGLLPVQDRTSLPSATPSAIASPYESSALPPSAKQATYSASSAGSSVLRTDVSSLSGSYAHDFKSHAREHALRMRDERRAELDAAQAREGEEDGPEESRSRMGFEAARRMARGEAAPPPPANAGDGKGGDGGGGRGRDSRASDERVWKTFMSKQRNRR